MRKFPLIFLFILLILSACFTFDNNHSLQRTYFDFNQQQKKVNIIEYERIESPLNLLNDERKLGRSDYFFNDTTILLIKKESYTNNLVIFDLLKGGGRTINFDKTGYKSFLNFHYHNPDSIFLLYSDSENESYHDSLIFLCNNLGDVLKCYSLKEAPVFLHTKKTLKENEQVYLFFNWDSPITYNNNNLFLHFIPQASYLGDTVFQNSQIAGYIDVVENKFHSINLKYPEINFGKEFYNVYDSYFFSNIAHDGDIIYAFKYSPTIIKYNYKTGKSNRFQIKSSVFDTIYSAKKINEIASGHDFNSPYPKYYKLQYDKFRNLYYRFVLLPEQYGNKNFMVIVADTSFNVVAEGFTYKEKQHEFMFTDDYFFDGNDCYKMKFREGTNQELISVLKRKSITKTQIKKPLTHYMKNFANIEVENYTAIFMLSNETCEYTKDFFSTYIKQILKNMKNMTFISL